jgi:hypothetical protein
MVWQFKIQLGDEEMRYLALFSFLFLMAACANVETRLERVVDSDQPIDFKIGFKHGCASRYASDGYLNYKQNRDGHQYSNNDVYRVGWNEGFNSCSS